MQTTDQIYDAHLNEDSLLDELNTLRTKSLDTVLELVCLQDFNEVVPGVFNPRRIIEYMQERHRLNALAINDKPDLLKTVIYTYISKQDKRECKSKFSNNMSFRDDILIICYLHEIINANQSYKKMNIMNVLLKLIVKKYRLNDSKLSMNWNSNITLSDISLSFPSISLDVFNNNFGGIFQCITSMFPNMDLPKMIFIQPSTMICRILPKLSNPPIAILIIIYLNINDRFCSTIEQIPFATVYSTVLANYNSTSFPESLKIFLCRREIVTIVDGNYQFNSSFMLYSNQAKDFIRELRKTERSKDILGFEDILSKL